MIEELKAPKGKFRIVGIDKLEPLGQGHFVVGDYNTFEEAIKIAHELSRESGRRGENPSIATVYYVYDENGDYLGGDIYSGE